jgi:hypothetical protein
MKISKKNVFLVEVEDQFALIDRSAGLIHIVDAENARLWESGQDVSIVSTSKTVIAAGTSGGAPGSVGGGFNSASENEVSSGEL